MTQYATFHDLKGQSVFITGGGAGIGASLTDGFLAAGANVSFVQRSDATEFCAEMEAKHGKRPHFMKCDITDVDRLRACMDEGADLFGPITVLVNNAANDTRHDTLGMSVEDWTGTTRSTCARISLPRNMLCRECARRVAARSSTFPPHPMAWEMRVIRPMSLRRQALSG